MKKQEIINFGLKLGIKQNNILKVLEKITGLNKNQLFLRDEIDDKFIKEIENTFSRLVSGEPIEYILKKAEFFGFDFFVDSRVLVPRNDTEIMVDQVLVLEIADIYIDIGTGSGAILISILNTLKEKNKILPLSFAIDISIDALDVADINIKKYNLENKIKLIESDLLKGFLPYFNNLQKDNLENIIITANLPYIKNQDFENMDRETIEFEPDGALYGGEETGFEIYERLIFEVFSFQNVYNIKKIILFIEIGFDQKQIAIDFLKKQNLNFEIFKDNGNIDRCIKIYFNLNK